MLDFMDVFSWQIFALITAVLALRYWIKGRQFDGKESAKGKIAVVTGANCGIGKQIVRILNKKGAKVYLACRSLENGQKAMAQLAVAGCQVDRLILLEVDLSSFASVRNFVNQFKERETKLDILVNNAGIMFYPKFKITGDGHELTWQTNYLSHFLLTELLLPLLKKSGDECRIVNVSSRAHFGAGQINLETVDRREGYETREAYSRSKLAQVMHAAYMTKLLRLEGSPVTINTCHPGIVYTRIMRHTPFATNSILRSCLAPVAWFALKTPKDGAQCPVYCALSKELNGVSGKYASECKIHSANELVKDEKLCKELYEYSKLACGLEKDE